ncbi:MAG: hypothetical protein IPK50_08330 [Fibrobacterota bacterium]|nr:hypothetical protein [Fibrobacterota bacterium]QQS06890.1 MAG: hypothetical protein IPK50_08330 [Fibrobacterota bacterium]
MNRLSWTSMFMLCLMPLMSCDELASEESDGELSLQLNMSYELVNVDAIAPLTYASVSAKSKTGGMKFSYRILDYSGADVGAKFKVPSIPTPKEDALSFQDEHWLISIPKEFSDLGDYKFEVTLSDKNGMRRTKTAPFEVSNSARNRGQAIYTAGVNGFSDALRSGATVQWSGKMFFDGSHMSFRTRVLRLRDTSDWSSGFTVDCPSSTTSSPFDLSEVKVKLAKSSVGTEEYLFEIRGEDEDENWLIRRDTLRVYSSIEY